MKRLSLLQGNLGTDVDGEVGDRDPHQIGRENLQHLGADHAARLQGLVVGGMPGVELARPQHRPLAIDPLAADVGVVRRRTACVGA